MLVGEVVSIKEEGEVQCFSCFLLGLEWRERDGLIFGEGLVEVEDEANLLDWLLSFFFSDSAALFAEDLT